MTDADKLRAEVRTLRAGVRSLIDQLKSERRQGVSDGKITYTGDWIVGRLEQILEEVPK